MGASPQTPGIYRAGANPEVSWVGKPNGVPEMTPRFGLGPWIGARVASQRSPVFRPGRWHCSQSEIRGRKQNVGMYTRLGQIWRTFHAKAPGQSQNTSRFRFVLCPSPEPESNWLRASLLNRTVRGNGFVSSAASSISSWQPALASNLQARAGRASISVWCRLRFCHRQPEIKSGIETDSSLLLVS